MAISTFSGMQTSLRGLLAHQRSLDITGHNVANASTVGYSRQEAVLNASLPQLIPAGMTATGAGAQLGTGVDVGEYRRIRDQFLDVQFRAQASLLGDADARARSLEGVELSLAEPGENGLAHQLGKLWSAWANVANDASSIPARQALVEQAKTVATTFSQLDAQLASIAGQASAELQAIVAYDPAAGVYGDVASIATELAQVGAAIRDAVLVGQAPLDLLDHRDVLLDKLAQFGSVQTIDLGDGGVRVLFGGAGDALVDDHRLDDPAVPGDQRVVWSGDPADLVNPGGKLGALQALAGDDGVVDSYRTELARIAQTLADSVNGIHSQGPSGAPFFTFDPALGAAGLSVAVDLASVQTGRGATRGANDLALEIAGLRGGAVDGAYQAFVARIGSEARQNTRVGANAQVLLDAVEDRRQSAAGVSLDEEMTNLIRFQRGYQASARTMSTLDEMLDVLINRTGRVGL